MAGEPDVDRGQTEEGDRVGDRPGGEQERDERDRREQGVPGPLEEPERGDEAGDAGRGDCEAGVGGQEATALSRTAGALLPFAIDG